MSLDGAIWRNDRTDGRASGAQKIGCRSNAFWGSAAKRQPPFVPEIVGRAIQPRGSGKGSIVLMVFAIAAQPLPGNVRGFRLFEICVIFFGSPIDSCHVLCPHCTNDGELQHDKCDPFWLRFMRPPNSTIRFPDWASPRIHVSVKGPSSFALRPSSPEQIPVAMARHPLRSS